jgi:hypothetical protein
MIFFEFVPLSCCVGCVDSADGILECFTGWFNGVMASSKAVGIDHVPDLGGEDRKMRCHGVLVHSDAWSSSNDM